MSVTSNEWRSRGNDQYKLAGQTPNLSTAAEHLKTAVNSYEEAIKSAKTEEERCFALRNMGMANWHLGKNCDNRIRAAVHGKKEDGRTYHYNTSHRTDFSPYFMLHFYKEAINAFRQCVPLVNQLLSMEGELAQASAGAGSLKPKEFLDKVNTNVNDCATEALSFLINMDYFSTYKKRIEQLDHLLGASGDVFRDWSAILHLEKAKTYHKWAVTEIERSKNYVTALHCLKECYSPIEIIQGLAPAATTQRRPYRYYRGGRRRRGGGRQGFFSVMTFGQFSKAHGQELRELKQSIALDTAVADALRLIEEGDRHMKNALLDSEQLDVDGVHHAIDDYRAAVVALRDHGAPDLALEAEALSKIGQAYFNVLKNEAQGKTYCMAAVQMVGILEHQNFAGKDWYDKAAGILKHLQDEQRKKEEDEVRKDREPFLKALEKELKDLQLLSSKSAEYLIAELPKKFVPKHKGDSKVIKELADMKFTDETPRSDVKKALSKLILLYHPDHVDIKAHGGQYFVLCEEITKVITRKYECFK